MRSRRLSQAGFMLAGVAASALFLWLAARGVDVDVFWESLRNCDYLLLVPALLALAATVAIRSWRWQLLFAPATRPPLGAVTRAMLVGQLFNVILPMRAGEAARIVVLNQEAGTSRAESLGTAVVERVYDVLALLLLVPAAAPFLPEVTWLRRAAVLAAVLLALVVVAAVVVDRFGARPMRLVLRPLARLPGITRAHRRGRRTARQVSARSIGRVLRLRRCCSGSPRGSCWRRRTGSCSRRSRSGSASARRSWSS